MNGSPSSPVAPIQGPQRSGFNKSFKNLLTAKVGTLVPVLCDPVIAGTRVSLKDAFNLQMPPLATDAFMNVNFKQEAFFVPASSLYGGFNDVVTGRELASWQRGQGEYNSQYKKVALPYIHYNYVLQQNLTNRTRLGAPNSLSDYLGFRDQISIPNNGRVLKVNPFPFLAYHRIWDRYYRNSLVTKTIFSKMDIAFQYSTGSEAPTTGRVSNLAVSNLPYTAIASDSIQRGIGEFINGTSGADMYAAGIGYIFPDGVNLFELRQRNFGADYFTTATPTAQRGDPAAVNLKVNVSDGQGTLTVAAIRGMNALQLWKERNNMTDDDIHAYNRAHYGVNKTGFGESLPVFLGSSSTPVYSKGVTQTAAAEFSDSQNPFYTVGAKYGNADCTGEGDLIDSFEAPEFGYIVVLASLVPVVNYATGVNRHLLDLVGIDPRTEIPDALLQMVGPQEVYRFELFADPLTSDAAERQIFGYQQRYAHYMERQNEVHGLFRDGQSLKSFALQRSFDDEEININTEFLKIPEAYMDQVAAVEDSISGYGYWIDMFFDYKVSMPLAAYSIPSLENPAGPTEFVRKPGQKLG